MKKLNEKGLDKFLITAMSYMKIAYEDDGIPWTDEDEQPFQQIRARILNKPKVSREFVEKWLEENWDEDICRPGLFEKILNWLIKMLQEAGFEVEE